MSVKHIPLIEDSHKFSIPTLIVDSHQKMNADMNADSHKFAIQAGSTVDSHQYIQMRTATNLKKWLSGFVALKGGCPALLIGLKGGCPALLKKVAVQLCLLNVLISPALWAHEAMPTASSEKSALSSTATNSAAPRRLADGQLFFPKELQRHFALTTELVKTAPQQASTILQAKVIADPRASGVVQSTQLAVLLAPADGRTR